MKLFVTNTIGPLGHDIVIAANKRGHSVIPSDATIAMFSKMKTDNPAFHLLDITKKNEVLKTMRLYKPDAIIHCPSSTVEKSWEDESAIEIDELNQRGTINIALAAKCIDAKMVYISMGSMLNENRKHHWPPNLQWQLLKTNAWEVNEVERGIISLLTKSVIVRIDSALGLDENGVMRNGPGTGEIEDYVLGFCDCSDKPKDNNKTLSSLIVEII